MEVGIEDCLHIEFEYDKSKYHLKDTVVGKIYFLLVRLLLLPCTAVLCILMLTCTQGQLLCTKDCSSSLHNRLKRFGESS